LSWLLRLIRTAVVPVARVGFLHFALDSDLREPSLLVAARPISGACAPRRAHGKGFRRADDFEIVRACDRSRVLEYGVTKTRV
jgi:hypothetical protein